MRRFRFVGYPAFSWILPVEKNTVYDIDYFIEAGGDLIQPSHEWQEVFEPESKPLHKDTDLGYFPGLAMQAMIAVYTPNCSKKAILLAKELIKELDQETK